MKNVLELGKIIDPNDFEVYTAVAKKLDVINHNYGSITNIPDIPCWMEYKNQGHQIGSIAFSRNTNKHPILVDMVNHIINELQKIFPASMEILPQRVHFLRTIGNIPIHKDESGRYSCINIGVENSNLATTYFSIDGIHENFSNNHESINIQDGYAYLLNTNEWHSVNSSSEQFRYLITYGFGTSFHILKKMFLR